MPKISIIIPVYNTEKYIEKCLESLLHQTMKDIEVIVVNDGSTDNSENAIKEWMKRYQKDINIKYFRKSNGGLSDARNYGVTKATGKYISFVDSDDYLEKDLYKNLLKYINQDIDIIKFKMTTLNEKGEIIEKLDGPIFEKCAGEEAFEKLCTVDRYLEVACTYLYNREFFLKNKFKYKIGAYHEDFGLTPFIIIKAKSVVSTENFGYYYLQRENSITDNKNVEKEKKKAYDVLHFYDEAMIRIKKSNIKDKTKMLLKRYYTNSLLIKTGELEGEAQKKYIEQIKLRKVYKNIKSENLKQFIKKIVIKINIKLYLKMR